MDFYDYHINWMFKKRSESLLQFYVIYLNTLCSLAMPKYLISVHRNQNRLHWRQGVIIHYENFTFCSSKGCWRYTIFARITKEINYFNQ